MKHSLNDVYNVQVNGSIFFPLYFVPFNDIPYNDSFSL